MSTVQKLDRDLGRVEGKIDTFIMQMKAQDDRTTDLEVRTRKVENRQHLYSGASGVLGVIFAAFVEHFFGAHT